MNVSLTPELEKWVETRVQSGLYASSSEVVRTALRLLFREEESRQQAHKALLDALEVGFKALEAGEVVPLDANIAEKIRQIGLKRQG